jgi:glycosyltransferase involved in cell wall biosynthesis
MITSIIIIDDGSIDQTWEVLQNLQKKNSGKIKIFRNRENRNIGYCFQLGVKNASFPYIQMICADVTYEKESYIKMIHFLGKKDIISPYVANLKEEKNFLRLSFSRAFRFLINLFFGLRMKYHNGLHIFGADQLNAINIFSEGFFFQVECLVKIIRTGASFVEIEGRMDENLRKDKPRALTPKNMIDLVKCFFFLLIKDITPLKKKKL